MALDGWRCPGCIGTVRAIQDTIEPAGSFPSLPVLIHGDAAFAGQGIIMECFGFSGLAGYNTGGKIGRAHV